MSDLDNSFQNVAQENPAAATPDSAETGGYPEEQAQMTEEFHEVQTPSHARDDAVPQTYDKTDREKRAKPLVTFGIICTVLLIAAAIFADSSTPDTSDDAKAALANKISTTLAAGTILLTEDENIGEQQDYTLAHELTGRNETKIWIWDYAAEDGDYVQVLVNGVPYGSSFMIKHKPVLIPVSMPGLAGMVQVRGVRDGGGGITYAVRYELNNTTYFNSAPEGDFNTYTLVNTTN